MDWKFWLHISAQYLLVIPNSEFIKNHQVSYIFKKYMSLL